MLEHKLYQTTLDCFISFWVFDRIPVQYGTIYKEPTLHQRLEGHSSETFSSQDSLPRTTGRKDQIFPKLTTAVSQTIRMVPVGRVEEQSGTLVRLCRDNKKTCCQSLLFSCYRIDCFRRCNALFATLQTLDIGICQQRQVACRQSRSDQGLSGAALGARAAAIASTEIGVVAGLATPFVPGEYGTRCHQWRDTQCFTTFVNEFDNPVFISRGLWKIRGTTGRFIRMLLCFS